MGRLLVVEDNPVNRQVMTRLLNKLGFEVELAENGQIAVELASQERFGAILMDCEMPVMDGYTATAAIRKIAGYGDVPIIAATAYSSPDDVAKCHAAGMNEVLPKPVRRASLVDVLDRWVRDS